MKKMIKSIAQGFVLASVFAMASNAMAAAEPPSPKTVAGATYVDVTAAKKLWEAEAAFLDPRKQSDWDAGHIPDAVHFDIKNPAAFNEANIEKALPNKTAKVVTYCNGDHCSRAAHAAQHLVKWGYKNVYYFRDGFPAWKAAGNSVE